MDEPLSNLDAKLRVQTRAEIAKLQSDLGVTTIYVTHDQVEALTMGDRVAVMRKGELQQVDDPQTLYDRPVNIFVGGFIGSPAMNMLDATIEQSNGGLSAKIGKQTISLGQETLEHRPALKAFVGKQVIIGIRPEDLEDAALVSDAPADRRLVGRLELREALGSEIMAHFAIEAAHAESDEIREIAAPGRRRGFRFQDRGRGQRGDHRRQIRRALAHHRRHRGDGDCRHSRAALLRPCIRRRHLRRYALNERSHPMRKRWPFVAAVVAVGALAALAGTQLASASKSSQSSPAAVSGSITFDGIWTGSEATAFGKVIKAFNEVYPNVKVNYKPVGNNVPTVLATAIAGGHPPDMADIAQPGLIKQLAKQGT